MQIVFRVLKMRLMIGQNLVSDWGGKKNKKLKIVGPQAKMFFLAFNAL